MTEEELLDAKIAEHESKRLKDGSASFAALSAVGAALLYSMGAVSNAVQQHLFRVSGAVKLDVYDALLSGAIIALVFGPFLWLAMIVRNATIKKQRNKRTVARESKIDRYFSNVFSNTEIHKAFDYILFLKFSVAVLWALLASAVFGVLAAMFVMLSTQWFCFECVAYELEQETVYGRSLAADNDRLVIYLQNRETRVVGWDNVVAIRPMPDTPPINKAISKNPPPAPKKGAKAANVGWSDQASRP